MCENDFPVRLIKEKSYILTMVANRCRDFPGSGNFVFSARYMIFTLSYDAEKQTAVCYIEEGGGLG